MIITRKRFVVLFLFISICSIAQEKKEMKRGGEVLFNPKTNSCLSDSDRAAIVNRLTSNITQLRVENKYRVPTSKAATSFGWPVQKSVDAPYNETWAISYYIDHDTTFGIIDYNCGNKAYNGHKGVDIYTWPFWWEQMELNHTEIVAAEAGQIIYKQDQNFDKNCSGSGQWNAVYVQHADGSTAWYGHMKKESLTTKEVGDMVSKGEFLGIIGSSGNSNGPHLHFEVYDSGGRLIDPYFGGCSSLNAVSWWDNQKAYRDSNINAVLTHSDYPDFNTCPEIESSNLQNNFSLTDTVILGVYLREQLPGTTIDLEIIRPDNTIKDSWTFDLVDDYTISYWTWTDIPDMIGEWTWKATYLGQTITHNYSVSTLSVGDFNLDSVAVYPNPANHTITIQPINEDYDIKLYDISGREVLRKHHTGAMSHQLDVSYLSDGVYVLSIKTISGKKRNLKIVKH